MNSCEKAKSRTKDRGYLGELNWQELMSKRYTQYQCKKCLRYHVWKRREEVKR